MRKVIRLVLAGGVATGTAALLRRLLGEDKPGTQPPPPAPPRRRRAKPRRTNPSSSSPSRDQLYKEAARLGVKGRSKMKKQQLQDAVDAAKTGGSS
jgi:hypothetical protein